MQRQPTNLFTERRQPSGAHQVETFEEGNRTIERLNRRSVEPGERSRVTTPREHVECRPCQIDTTHFRFAVSAQTIARIPESPDQSRRFAPGASCPLIGGVHRHTFGLERVDAARRIVARHFLQSGIDDSGHAGHGQRCFGDVRGDDDATRRGLAHREILLLRRKGTMK